MEDAPRPVPYAHPADIVRSHQKDEQWQGELRRLAAGAAEELLGHRRAGELQAAVALAADFGYGLATAVLSGRTLGEEYSELLVVQSAARGLQPASRRRRLMALLMALLPPVFLMIQSAAAGRRRANRPGDAITAMQGLTEALPLILRCHLAMFYIWGTFRNLSDRILGLRPLSLSERPYRSFTYVPLGLLLLSQLLGQGLATWIAWRRRRQPAAEPTIAERVMPSFGAGASSSGVAAGIRQPMCRICMCPAECATSTPCGHLFCWYCIASWCAMRASCPLCRAAAPPQQLLPLCHYQVNAAGPTGADVW